jgi:hypothetical protein
MVFYESSTFESDVTLLPIALASLQRSLARVIHQGDVRATVTICYVAGGKQSCATVGSPSTCSQL